MILDWYAGDLQILVEATKEMRIQWQNNRDLMWSFWIHTHSAHLADLIADQPAEGRRAIANAAAEVQHHPFESPRYFVWISELRQELYDGNNEAAVRTMESGWQQFSNSRLSTLSHYVWVANSLRLCCYLASATGQSGKKDFFLREASAICKRLSSNREPLFALVAKAQELVVKAAQGNIAPRSRWTEAVETLRRSDMRLFAIATAWHASIYWPDVDFCGHGKTAEQCFLEQGCVAPRKLMQVILPLPA